MLMDPSSQIEPDQTVEAHSFQSELLSNGLKGNAKVTKHFY